jgi:hypothetical protein
VPQLDGGGRARASAREIVDDLLGGHPRSEVLEDVVNSYARADEAGPAAACTPGDSMILARSIERTLSTCRPTDGVRSDLGPKHIELRCDLGVAGLRACW